MKTVYSKPTARVYAINASGFIASGGACQPKYDGEIWHSDPTFESFGNTYPVELWNSIGCIIDWRGNQSF